MKKKNEDFLSCVLKKTKETAVLFVFKCVKYFKSCNKYQLNNFFLVFVSIFYYYYLMLFLYALPHKKKITFMNILLI